MKKLLTILAFAVFTVSINAQETKPATPIKKESCCAKKCTENKKAKCTADEKMKCEKKSNSCCAKK